MKLCDNVPCQLTPQVSFAVRSQARAGVLCSCHRWDRYALWQDNVNDVPAPFTRLYKSRAWIVLQLGPDSKARGGDMYSTVRFGSRQFGGHSGFDGRPTLFNDMQMCPGTIRF